MNDGKMEHIIGDSAVQSASRMNSNTMQPGARGRKVINRKKQSEKDLLEWLDKQWSKNKKITRTIIFNQILKIDPTYLGGRDEPKIFKKLKSWFYGEHLLNNILSEGNPYDYFQRHTC